MTKDAAKEIGADAQTTRARRCPICGKPAAAAFRPFCSLRCADVDLNRWLSGVYVVQSKAEEDEDGEAGPRSKPESSPEPDDAA
jgi:hypothetical protein